MKKFFICTIVAALTGVMQATAQNDYNVVINLNNGSTITLGANDVKDFTFTDGELTVTGNSITQLAEKIDSLAQRGLLTDSQLETLDQTIGLVDERLTNHIDGVADVADRLSTLESQIQQLQQTVEDLKNATPAEDKVEMVDLGLSVKWATCNIGASKPSEVGSYFAWGETATKDDYSEDTWEASENIGEQDPATFDRYIGGSAYDAVTAALGEGYRMPSYAEAKELIDNCDMEWVEEDGVTCAKLTSTKNGNSILLPVSSWMTGTSLRSGAFLNRCYYWTATSNFEEDAKAYAITIYNTTKTIGGKNNMYYGMPVRPVQP